MTNLFFVSFDLSHNADGFFCKNNTLSCVCEESEGRKTKRNETRKKINLTHHSTGMNECMFWWSFKFKIMAASKILSLFFSLPIHQLRDFCQRRGVLRSESERRGMRNRRMTINYLKASSTWSSSSLCVIISCSFNYLVIMVIFFHSFLLKVIYNLFSHTHIKFTLFTLF